MTMSGVFVYGYYGVNNLGDDLLAEAVVSGLIERRFGSVFYLRNHGDVPIVQKYPQAVHTNLQSELIGHKGFISKIFALFKYILGYHNIFKACGSFILGGGTLISAYSSRNSLFILLILVCLAKIHGMKLYGLGLGLGLIQDRIKRSIARYILHRFEWIGVRDEYSLRAGRDMAPRANLNLTSDLVFSLLSPTKPLRDKPHSEKKLHIGVTLAGPFLNAPGNETIKLNVLGALRDALRICASRGISVTLISFQEAVLADGIRKSDSAVFEEWMANDPDLKWNLTKLTANNGDIQNLYQSLDLLIGMRFHGMVLASLNSVPFVGFSYDAKMQEFCKSYGMPYTNLGGVSCDWLVNAVESALGTAVDPIVSQRFAELSKKNFEIFETAAQTEVMVKCS